MCSGLRRCWLCSLDWLILLGCLILLCRLILLRRLILLCRLHHLHRLHRLRLRCLLIRRGLAGLDRRHRGRAGHAVLGRLHRIGRLVLRRHLEHGRLDGVRRLTGLHLLVRAGMDDVLHRLAGRGGLLQARLRVGLDVYGAGSAVVDGYALLVHGHAARLSRSGEDGNRLRVLLLLALGLAPGVGVHDDYDDAKDPASTVREGRGRWEPRSTDH
jgi:hypothetical protein